MSKKPSKYDHKKNESKWQNVWNKERIYNVNLKTAKNPYYNLMMYPYPSAEGLHVGHLFAFGGADIHGRFHKMQGKEVFEPMGFDSGGMHSENFAIKMGVHPKSLIASNIKNFTRQLKRMGNMFDWDHSVDVMQPDFYRWTQWIFIQLFKAGLAYKKAAPVTWCPDCKTTVSDEQTEKEGEKVVCERCKTEVEKKNMSQWFLKITDYADRLLENSNKLNWSQKVLTAQKNWIGKKEGIDIIYEVIDSEETITCFTTRPDTNYGATFIVLAPEHESVLKITSPDNLESVKKYIKSTKNKSELERIAEGHQKTGVFTGAYGLNQLTNSKMPIWISDFVLATVGTGAVVGVPGHDLRDFEFAQKFNIPITRVVVGSDGDTSEITKSEQVQEEEGAMINSDFLNGMDIHKATAKIMDYIEEKDWGKKTSAYKIRDWCISRQRYWGPPIPMIYCEECAKQGKGYKQKKNNEMTGWYPVPDQNLPVLLPEIDDYLPDGSGKAPLARHPEFVETKCPACGSKAQRETDVSDTFLDSSWYFLRYPSTHGGDIDAKTSQVQAFDPTLTKKWLPVSHYSGGAEHSVLHLLYSRFITMALYDMGHLDFEEPFPNFYAHGLIIKDGAKMSKSRGNVIDPDEYIDRYGADVMRLYLAFMGPYSEGGDFNDSGIAGMERFANRFWQDVLKWHNYEITDPELEKKLQSKLQKTIKRVTSGMNRFKYNTSIAAVMEMMNLIEELTTQQTSKFIKTDKTSTNLKSMLNTVLQLMAPLAPHMSEELWQKLNKSDKNKFVSVHERSWPVFDSKKIIVDTITIVVQVNGKLRASLEIKTEQAEDKAKILELAKKEPQIQKYLEGQKIKKEIFVPGRLVNFVV